MDRAARWRLFVAIELGAAARGALVAAQGACRPLGLPVRWVEPPGAHLTLKFLGETDRALVGPIGEALRGVAGGRAAFALRTAAPGAFPNLRRPRVLWLGLAGALDRLAELQAATEEALAALGFPRETRPFSPHLTLGRAREDRAREMAAVAPRLAAAFADLAARPGAPLPVAVLHLFRSELAPGGARYTALASAPLGGMPGPAAR